MKNTLLRLFLLLGVFTSVLGQGFKEHKIIEGESLNSIVQKYQVSPYELYQLNPDLEEGVNVGDVLVLLNNNQYPFDANLVNLKKYKVKKKETISSIAKDNSISDLQLKKYNTKLYSSEVKKGDKIKIPVFSNLLSENVISLEKEVTPQDSADVELNSSPVKVVTHVVKPKEGKYGISKKYSITIEELEKQNPEIISGLKIGQVLTITQNIENRTSEENVDDKDFSFYTVQPKEGFYRLTKKLGVSKDSLIALNPVLSEGIKLGMKLKYPKSNWVKSDLPSYNLLDSLSNYQTKHITLMLPLMANKISDTDSVSNIVRELTKNRTMKRALDFYSGVLIAIDSAKNIGISTKLRVFDTQYNKKDKAASLNRINELVSKDYVENEVVIGPLVSRNLLPAARAFQSKNISIVAPYPVSSDAYPDNLYQSNSSEVFQRAEMIRFLETYSLGKQVVIITDEKMSLINQELLVKFPQAKVITPRKGNLLIPSDFNGILSGLDENIIIVEAKAIGLLATVSTILDTKLKNHKISLFTTSSYKTFKGIENRYKSKLNLHFPSMSKNISFKKEDVFLRKFKEKYSKLPNQYAIKGFDLTMDVLLRQAVAGSFSEGVKTIGETKYIENKFSYDVNPSGGFVNNSVYILRYTPEMNIEEASLLPKDKKED